MIAALKLVVDKEASTEAPVASTEAPRASKRSRVMLGATITHAAAEIRVVIRDMSAGGAMITSPVAPRVGSYVTLHRDPISVLAQVIWQRGQYVGLRFRDHIDEGLLLIAIGRRPAG
jgi:hypothetical protein